LNLAGGTTAITSADCSVCNDDWCFTFDMELTDGGATPYSINSCLADWDSGVGWQASVGGECGSLATGVAAIAAINFSFTSTYIRHVVIVVTSLDRTTGVSFAVGFPAINRGGTPTVHSENNVNGEVFGVDMIVNGSITGITAEAQSNPNSGVVYATGTAVIKQVTFYGSGDCPFGDPNCFE